MKSCTNRINNNCYKCRWSRSSLINWWRFVTTVHQNLSYLELNYIRNSMTVCRYSETNLEINGNLEDRTRLAEPNERRKRRQLGLSPFSWKVIDYWQLVSRCQQFLPLSGLSQVPTYPFIFLVGPEKIGLCSRWRRAWESLMCNCIDQVQEWSIANYRVISIIHSACNPPRQIHIVSTLTINLDVALHFKRKNTQIPFVSSHNRE